MEHNFNNRDFEDYVKQNADQYRMFPSEKVWDGIHNTLHARSKWYGFGLVLLILTTVSVTWVMLIPSNNNQQLADRLPAYTAPVKTAGQSTPTQRVVITPAKPTTVSSKYLSTVSSEQNDPFITSIPESPKAGTQEEAVAVITTEAEPVVIAPVHNTYIPYVESKTKPVYQHDLPEEKAIESAAVPAVVISNNPVVIESQPATPVADKTEENIASVEKNADLLTIESVVNSYKYTPKKNKFTLRAYFTPTVSYRSLNENNPFISASRSNGNPATTTLAIADVNSVVTHKPDMGLQLGVNAGFDLTKRLTAIAGLQFNVNKYDIRAYDYPSETATIALISGTTRPSSVSAETTYRNYSGTEDANWLPNLYFSASLPLGLEVKLNAPGKTEIGVGGTIQPTYVLGNRSYVLSTDYKNYAEIPSLVRKWNMSTGLEAFAGYSTGRLNWRIGPQVRYQLFSTFRAKYPVKEHLFDFGVKIGITLK